jgi:putative sigma-54 modulation protein
MNITLTGRNIEITQALKNNVEEKLSKYEKYFKSDIEVQATMGVQKTRQIFELTIPLKDDVVIRVEESSEDMYTSIDLAVDKLARQIQKHKTKLEKRYRSHDTIRFDQIPLKSNPQEVEQEHVVVKAKKFPIKPMDSEEAILQMEMLGHNFFVFKNSESDEVNVVYQRKDGKYGLIEPVE